MSDQTESLTTHLSNNSTVKLCINNCRIRMSIDTGNQVSLLYYTQEMQYILKKYQFYL